MSKIFFSDAEKNKYIKESLEKRLGEYNKLNYVYAVMNKKNMDEMIIISNFPEEVAENYLGNKYQNVDPVIINALNRFSPFSWDESLKVNSIWSVGRVFEKIKSHNVIEGHAFVLHDHANNLAMLLFYMDKFLVADYCDNLERNKNELQGVLIYIHEMLLHVYREENERSATALSPREAEILYWCTQGKTYAEVADMLELAVSTIKFHMGKIVKKMGVKNAKHAISLAVEVNIMPTSPTK